MIVQWAAGVFVPTNDKIDGTVCECGKPIPHEIVEFSAISDGRLLKVKSVQIHGTSVHIVLDA
jgi:hypothetical protein